MVQFYLPPDQWKHPDGDVRLEGDEARHARDAFRLDAGDAIRLFNGMGAAALGRIRTATKTALQITIEKELAPDPSTIVRIDLAQALVPNETMDQIVRQAAELGVSRIWPVACDRSVVRLDAEKRLSKVAHWKKTVLAACKQCDRNTLPEVMPVVTARDLAAKFAGYDRVLVACPVDPEGELQRAHLGSPSQPDGPSVAAHDPAKRLLVAIGPEGDFSPEEMTGFKKQGARVVSLGPLILKSDTAAIAALSVLQFLNRQK